MSETVDTGTENLVSDEGSQCIDVAIIGAGPAGLTAGLYAARAGFDAVIFERISPGGQLAQTEHIENYPGFPSGINGFELAFSMKQQADHFGVRHIGEEVTALDVSPDPKVLETPFGKYCAKSIIVASGARPRKLGLEFEDELQGRGISYCATCDGNFFRDKDVMVVGGGNTAVGDVIYLSRICRKVYLVHRRDTLRSTKVYLKALSEIDNLEIIWNARPSKLLAENGMLGNVAVELIGTDEVRNVAVEALFVAVGTEPNTEFLGDQLELNDAGYVVADETGLTPVPGVFVAGDVRTKSLYQVVTAVSDGAMCAEKAAESLAI